MGMCVQIKKIPDLLLLLFCIFFLNCEVMDTFLPSAGNYKINIQINSSLLDECSFVISSDEIRPFFEESISNDQDVTALVIFLRNSKGEVISQRIIYSLEHDDSSLIDNELIISVENLDNNLPSFPIPDMPMGMYTIVSQVMSGRNILQRTEKSFFYLGAADFSYEGINVYLPGVTESSQLIPRETVVMLEVDLNFSDDLDPYIIWYEGRKKISEGVFSEGAGQIFWRAPELSGFFTLRAEVFPVMDYARLAGYKKETSLLVTSKEIEMHLVSENIPQLVHWYTFEGSLNDLKITSAEENLLPLENDFKWMGVNKTYGLATGYEEIVNLVDVLIPENEINAWQILFRFFPADDGGILSVLFSADVSLHLFKEGNDFILTLASPMDSISQVFDYHEKPDESGLDFSFLTAGIYFSITPEIFSAHINIFGDFFDIELESETIFLDLEILEITDEFQIILGSLPENNFITDEQENITGTINVIWDEFALYYMPQMEIFIPLITPPSDDDEPSVTAVNLPE